MDSLLGLDSNVVVVVLSALALMKLVLWLVSRRPAAPATA
mgnify:CR=1 FL=1